MEQDSTQAVTPTSTTVEPSVKRLRRGDVRENGKIFWEYASSCSNGEWWLSPKQFSAEKAKEEAQRAKKNATLSAKKAALTTKLCRGDTREDGMVFWAYAANCVDGEYWMTPEEFAAEKAKQAKKRADLSAKKAALTTKLRRGDTRENGKIFWKYGPNYANGEWWVTAEEFAAKKAKEAKKNANLSVKKASLPTKLRRGDVREDGKRFWGYDPTYANGERWLTPEEFAAKRAKEAEKQAELSAKKAASPTKLRRGDTRDDGMVFWRYGPNYPNGECWMTPEQFAAEKAKKNARKRERRATDPLYALKDRLRCRVSSALKRRGFKKNTKTATMLGCTYEEFKVHIESRLPLGMTWELFLSDGHLDHIVPLDAADTEADVYALNHFSNLRPMWGPENIAKNATLTEEHELPDNLHPKVKEIYLTAKKKLLDKAAQQGKL